MKKSEFKNLAAKLFIAKRGKENNDKLSTDISMSVIEAYNFLESFEKQEFKDGIFEDEQPPFYSKEQVIRIVAKFANTYNTDSFAGAGESLDYVIKEIRHSIDWDV